MQVLFRSLKCTLATTSLSFFITVMQKNRKKVFLQPQNEIAKLKKKSYKTEEIHVSAEKTFAFHMIIFLVLLIFQLINVFFYFPLSY